MGPIPSQHVVGPVPHPTEPSHASSIHPPDPSSLAFPRDSHNTGSVSSFISITSEEGRTKGHLAREEVRKGEWDSLEQSGPLKPCVS